MSSPTQVLPFGTDRVPGRRKPEERKDKSRLDVLLKSRLLDRGSIAQMLSQACDAAAELLHLRIIADQAGNQGVDLRVILRQDSARPVQKV